MYSAPICLKPQELEMGAVLSLQASKHESEIKQLHSMKKLSALRFIVGDELLEEQYKNIGKTMVDCIPSEWYDPHLAVTAKAVVTNSPQAVRTFLENQFRPADCADSFVELIADFICKEKDSYIMRNI